MNRQLGMLLLLLSLAVSACERERPPERKTDGVPVQEASQVQIFVTNSGIRSARLRGQHVFEEKQGTGMRRIFDRGVEVILYNEEDGSENSHITAEYGEFGEAMGNALLAGDVIVLTAEGDKVTTDTLVWDSKGDSISTHTGFRVYREKEIIFGDTLWSRTDFSEYKMQNIRGTMMIDE